jgi:hypothetical protein
MRNSYWLLALLSVSTIGGTAKDSPSQIFEALQSQSLGRFEQTLQTPPIPSPRPMPVQDFVHKQELQDNLFPITEKNINGYIDRNGKLVIKLDPKYYPFQFSEGLAAVEVDEKIGYIDRTGQFVIKPQFIYNQNLEGAETFSEGLAAVSEIDPQTGDYRSGYIDTTGKVVIPFQFYDEVHPFFQGVARVGVRTKDSVHFVFIDRKGKVVFDDPQLYEALDFSEGVAAIRVNETWRYIDPAGKTAVPLDANVRVISNFSEGVAAVSVLTKDCQMKWGYIDKTGKFVIQPQFTDAKAFSEGLAAVQVGATLTHPGQWGYIDKTGKFVIKPQFDDVFPSVGNFSEGLATIAVRNERFPDRNSLVGFIDKTGKWAIKPQFDLASSFQGGVAWVDRYDGTTSLQGYSDSNFGGEHSLIDRSGKFIWSQKYNL